MEEELDTKIIIANWHIYEEIIKKRVQCLKKLGWNDDVEDLKKKWELKKKLLGNQKNGEAKKKFLNIILSYKNVQEFIEEIEEFQENCNFEWIDDNEFTVPKIGDPIEFFI
jgi:hypothetical protein